MPRRFLIAAVQLALTLVLALLIAGVLQWFLGTQPLEAFLDQGPRLMLTFMDVGLVTWLVLLVIGAVRGRGLGFGMLGTILAALIAAALNLVAVTVIGVIQGGAQIFAIALGVEAGVVFLVAAIAIALVVHGLVKPWGASRIAA